MRTAFVTGASSGFGFQLSRRLLSAGWRVFATDVAVDGLEARLLEGLETDAGPRLRTLPMDVRRAEDVAAGAREAIGWSPPDVLVNNAGYAIFGTIEEADLEAIRDLIDVNVLGVARVTQALMPTLRERAGTVVMLSSVAGRTVFPESGYYAATKYAVEAMSDALFQEAATFGVRVRVIEPGSFDTNFLTTAVRSSKPRSPGSPYVDRYPTWDARKWGILEKPQDPKLVAEAIAASLDDPRPFLRVPVGPDAGRLLGFRDAVTADAWSILAAERNGLPPGDHEEGLVLSPAEVLALEGGAGELLALEGGAGEGPEAAMAADDRDRSASVAATLAALRHGHLDHWNDTKDGKRALALLSAL